MTTVPAYRPAQPSVHQDLDVLLLVDEEPTLPVGTRLSYRADDPWAVTMTFLAAGADGNGVEWTFARDLLSEGMRGPVGEGDVHVAPDGEGILLRLTSPAGSATFLLDAFDLAVFLDATFDVIPAGSESVDLEMDRLLDEVLGDR